MVSRFGPNRTFIPTKGSALKEDNFFTMGGLNLLVPDELLKDNESPYGRNFRVFKEQTDESRVAISKRDGHTFYSVPVGEADAGHNHDTTEAADNAITILKWFSQPFQVSAAGRLTKVTINLKNDNTGTGPVIVRIYSDTDGEPGTLLATSSILGSEIGATYAQEVCRFIEAPAVALATTYHLVIGLQSECTGDYKVSSNTATETALSSTDAGVTWTASAFTLNYYTFVSTNKPVKAVYRYYTSTTTPITLMVVDTNMYSINESTGAVTSITDAFTGTATDYRFATINNVCYIVNGVDVPKKWNGTTFASVDDSPNVSRDVCAHKNRLFLLNNDNKVQWGGLGSVETFESTDFAYIPAPQTTDLAIAMIPYQDSLTFFTRNTKYVLTGDNIDNISVREATASKGAVGMGAICKDGNYLYFLSDDDSIYQYNGGTDKPIADKVGRIIDNAANLDKSRLIVHDGKLRLYYAVTGSSILSNCLILDLELQQWMHDTEIYCGEPAVFNSQTDVQVLVHGSSLVGALYKAETSTSDLGKPILFDYWTKYYSFDHPSRKHRIKRLYVFFRGGTGPYYVDVQVDVNDINNPTSNPVYLGTTGAQWGAGDTWGGGIEWGGAVLEPTRLSVPGQARKHQIRFVQHGVDNPVDVLGFATYTKLRRPI